MSKKKKGMDVPVDIAKALWEIYADIVLGNFANELDAAITGLHKGHPIVVGYAPIIKRMREYSHDFNKK